MEYRDSADISGANVINAGGGGGGRGGGRLAIGGGAGLIIMILAMIFGFDPGSILGTQQQPDTSQQQPGGTSVSECKTAADIKTNRDCRWNAYVTSVEGYWRTVANGYTSAPLVKFSGQVQTGCGMASSQVGPFYCPEDGNVYIDTDFSAALLKQLGAKGGDAAEAYIVAHEYGHHIQDLTGVLAQVSQQGQQAGAGSPQVRLELQADCYAGVWFRHSIDDPNGPIQAVTQDDLNRVVDAAVAVGDDRIQQSQTGRISPESWTHGSSAQRKYWVAMGYKSGDPNRCDTFSATNLGG